MTNSLSVRPDNVTDGEGGSMFEAAQMAASAGLVYVSDEMPGLRRVRRPSGFVFIREDGKPLTAEAELRRIATLAIPPAYEDVWICANERGHLQATGRDARMRKQYRYHPDWREVRDGAKFARMVDFGATLPRLRAALRRDLAQKGLPRTKVLAMVVSLLDSTLVRIGNAEYARDNDSYGLTTLRSRHAKFLRGGKMLLRFRGKGGKEHEIPVDDKRLVALIRRCHELPGQVLFQYVDDDGSRNPIGSDQVNAYLKQVMGEDFTAKDFRTWGATLRAIALMTATPLPEPATESAIRSCINAAIKEVARELGNTPAVCRKSYINPIVFERWRSGGLQRLMASSPSPSARNDERFALNFLRKATLATRAVSRRTRRPSHASRVTAHSAGAAVAR